MSVWVMPSVDVYENFLKRSQAVAGGRRRWAPPAPLSAQHATLWHIPQVTSGPLPAPIWGIPSGSVRTSIRWAGHACHTGTDIRSVGWRTKVWNKGAALNMEQAELVGATVPAVTSAATGRTYPSSSSPAPDAAGLRGPPECKVQVDCCARATLSSDSWNMVGAPSGASETKLLITHIIEVNTNKERLRTFYRIWEKFRTRRKMQAAALATVTRNTELAMVRRTFQVQAYPSTSHCGWNTSVSTLVSRDLPGEEALSKPLWQVSLEACGWFLELLDGSCYFLPASIWFTRGMWVVAVNSWCPWMVASTSWETCAPGVTEARDIVNPTSGTKMTKKDTRTWRGLHTG